MKRKLFLLFCACLAFGPVRAVPSAAALDATRPLVNELMADDLAALKAGRKSAVAVADAARALVANAETEAAKYLLLKTAFSLFLRGKDYDKAADAVEALQAAVPDLPATDVVELVQNGAKGVRSREAPRLFAVYRAAQAHAVAEKERRAASEALAASPDSPTRLRTHAEWCVHAGDWPAARTSFAKLGTDFAAAAAATPSDLSAAANFWWNYEPVVKHAVLKDPADAFKRYAVALYQKGLASGAITGLKKTLAEKRIQQFAASDSSMDAVAPERSATSASDKKPAAAGPVTARSYVQKGLIAQWDGIENGGVGIHREKLTAWKDLRGEHDINLTKAAMVESDAIACSGAGYAGTMGKVFKKAQIASADLVVEYISSAVNSCVFSTGMVTGNLYDRNFGVSHGNQWFVWGSSSLGPKKPGRYAIHIDYVGHKCYFNGEPKPVVGKAGLDALPERGDEFYIGGFRNSGIKCKIHALRFYNRKLDADEIKQNAQIDAERFGL